MPNVHNFMGMHGQLPPFQRNYQAWSPQLKPITQKGDESSSDEGSSSSDGDSSGSGSSSDNEGSSCSESSYSKSQPGYSSKRKSSIPKGFKMGDLGGTIINEDMQNDQANSKLSTPKFKDQ
jgi:hypothetical protein